VSLQGEMDRIEDLKVARELSGKKEVKQEKEDSSEKYFDPIREHLSWNPTVLKNESGQFGWETLRNMFEDHTETNDEVSINKNCLEKQGETTQISTGSNSVEAGEALGVLQRVRSLLELW